MRLLFFIVVMPVLELWLLIEIGSRIGALYTLGLLLLSAVIGIRLLQQQGFSTLLKMNQRIVAGESPAQEALEGVVMALGGMLFLLPGFISDVSGLLCLFPPTRHWLVRYWLKQFINGDFVHIHVNGNAANQTEDIIEGEFRREVSEDKHLR